MFRQCALQKQVIYSIILIENIRSSQEIDKEQIITLLEVLRDNLTPGVG